MTYKTADLLPPQNNMTREQAIELEGIWKENYQRVSKSHNRLLLIIFLLVVFFQLLFVFYGRAEYQRGLKDGFESGSSASKVEEAVNVGNTAKPQAKKK